MNKHLFHGAFGAGLLAIGWVGAGFLRSHPLALAMTALIAAFYLMGAFELRRFHQATAALDRALDLAPEASAAPDTEAPPTVDHWLARVPAALRPAVRLRLEGDRVALPGPALAPTLAGLLVLLGMLGTFLGMVVTLGGTGAALERATDLATLRDSLAAPVRGLGLAFGTSVAGVAASAMLGLMTALCRRARQQAALRLDAQAAGPLRAFTRAHQRHAAFELQQQQARLLPALVGKMQALLAQVEAQARQSGERLAAGQERFHGQAESAYRELARSVDQTLRQSLTDSARVAAAAIQPVVQVTMDGITRETAALHGRIADTAQAQLDGLATRFGASTQALTDGWGRALERHQHHGDALAQRLDATLDAAAQAFEQRSAGLAQAVAGAHAALGERLSGALAGHLDGVAARLDGAAVRLGAAWQQALAQHEQAGAALHHETRGALGAAADGMARQSADLLQAVERSMAALQAQLSAREAERRAAWTASLAAVADTLQHGWQQAGADAAERQARIGQALEHTAGRIAADAEARTQGTLAEIGRLVQAASEAPRAAAEVVAQLRAQVSDSLARDHAMLEERARLLATLGTMMDTMQHAATQQKAAIDALVEAGADGLARAGERFGATVEAGSARIEAAAAQLTGSAVEVASLGEAFGHAVQLFSQSGDRLMAHLQRVEEALGRSTARSDEQLAYYVAQAREVIDLSLASQKQIVDDLQRIAARREAPAEA